VIDLDVFEQEVRVQIGECCLDTDADIALRVAFADLNGAERLRAERFVFDRDRDRFVRARGYLRRQLGASLDMAAKDVAIVGDEGEKPYLEGSRLSFSLSHSGSRAVVAIAAGIELGIDLEIAGRSSGLEHQLDDLSGFCLTSEEQASLAQAPPEQRVDRFLSYWTAKEARMKLTGEGLTLEPRDIALRLSDGQPIGYLRPDDPPADLQFIPLRRADLICCLAVGRDCAQAPTSIQG
jgi:4'-phosphopantetheinyl transferase